MTLRIMLVGLVASMGFELPSGPEASCWAQSGRDWVHARLADLTGSIVEADRPDAGPTDCCQADVTDSPKPSAIAVTAKAPDDTAFVAASEVMVDLFKADWLTMQDEGSPSESAPAPLTIEAPPVGLPEGEELAARSSAFGETDLGDVVLLDDMPSEVTSGADESSKRAERVSTAIRMTREAVEAWASLIQEFSDDACPAR